MSDSSIKKEKGIGKIKGELIKAFDENGNGRIDVEDLIRKCMKIPGVKINRADFLRAEFSLKLSPEIVDKAISENPMKAGVKSDFIDKVADNVIKYERIQASGISAVLSVPGGVTAVAAIPVDIAQYYAYLLRTMQKLLYLYGFPQLDLEYKEEFLDSESMRIVVVCLGIMFGVGAANILLHKLSCGLAEGLGKRFMRAAVTKTTTWYPALKKLCDVFGHKLSKVAFKEVMKKAMPVIGFVIGGSITFFSFGPCCNKLKNQLKDTIFSNPNYIEPVDSEIDLNDITFEEQDETIEIVNDDDSES